MEPLGFSEGASRHKLGRRIERLAVDPTMPKGQRDATEYFFISDMTSVVTGTPNIDFEDERSSS